MANLKEVISSIMRDMILAQHQANQFSQSLSEAYKQSGRISGLQPPAVALGGIELDLRYSIKEGVEEVEEESINYKETNRYLRYAARESANLLIKTLVHTVQNSGINYKDAGYEFIDNLAENHKYIRQLAKRNFAKLTEDVNDLMSNKNKLDSSKMEKALLVVAEKEILQNEDLKGLYALSEQGKLQNDINKSFQAALSKEIGDIVKESFQADFRKIQRFNSLQVVIDSEELSKLPDSAIQHIKLKINPQVIAAFTADNDEIM